MKKIILLFTALVAANLTQAQWEPDVRLTNDPGSSMTSIPTSLHTIAVSGDSVHIVWYDDRSGEKEIFYKRSIDRGLTWGEDIRLTNRDSVSVHPSIAVAGSVVHVAWTDYLGSSITGEIYYKRSTDGGNTWGEDTRLSDNPGYYTWAPCMAVSGSTIHLVYYTYLTGSGEIFYLRSTDSGLTWEPVVQLTNAPALSNWPSICAVGTVLHVAWYDRRDGNSEIYYKKSTNAGITWGNDKRLTFDNSISSDPCLGASESGVHVVWADERDGNSEIYYKRSTDGGVSWSADIRLTNTYSASRYNNLAVSGSGLFVVWADESDGNWKIYYKRSIDGGVNWEDNTRLTNAFAESNFPFVAVSDSTLHVIWTESRDGNEEIYYKRNPSGNIIVGVENELPVNSSQVVSIYPNPASTILNITFNSPSNEMISLQLMDMSGKILRTTNFHSAVGVNQYTIALDDFSNGLHFIELTMGSNRIFHKVIIQK